MLHLDYFSYLAPGLNMDGFMRALLCIVLAFCCYGLLMFQPRKTTVPVRIAGNTMGTTYHITYFDKQQRDFKVSIDSLLLVVNKAINTYDPSSEVSRFNKNSRGVAVTLPYLFPILKKSEEVMQASQGAFDPTVMPLVNAWGFGPEKPLRPDAHKIDSIRKLVGFEKIIIARDSITKHEPHVQLDFGGIGQGYGADVIVSFLKKKNITNMLVELGGEGMAVGKNLQTNKPWEIGILDPNSTLDNQFLKATVKLSGRAFTTAANYFNYYEIDGVKYSHTVDPKTGYPARRAILSASVFANDAATADAWDTAFMVMGHEQAIEVLKKHPELDALLIFLTPEGKQETYITPGLKKSIHIENNSAQP